MKLRKDKMFAIFCLALAVFLFAFTGKIKDLASASDPGARLFPYLGEAGIAVCSILILLKKDEGEEKEYLDKAGWIRLGKIFIALFLYAVGLNWLGFLVSTPFAVVAFITLLRGEAKNRPVITVALAAIVTVGLYFLFTKGFSIMLPAGKLFQGG